MIDGFVFYASFYEALAELDDADRLATYDAICLYALTGTEPDLTGIVKAMFKLMRPQIDANNRKREAGRKGGQANGKQTASKTETNASKAEAEAKQVEAKEKVKEKDKDKAKEKEKEKEKGVQGEEEKRKRFIPPTVDEVAAYCRERNNSIKPDRFVDFYAAKNWMVGKNKMVDWRACVRTWEQRDKQQAQDVKDKNKFNRFEQRSYDYDALEAQLIGIGGS